jgi:two-component system, NtrC family, sensor histidine kinase HydH
MKSNRSRGAISLPLVIVIILAGALILSILFYSYWQRLNHKVETILENQFNQQQLMLARKIADNVESYFDFLENALQSYAGLFQTTQTEDRALAASMAERFTRHKRFGLLQVTWYDPQGVGVRVFGTSSEQLPASNFVLPPLFQHWAQAPEHRGRLFLSETFDYPILPWKGRRVMRFITPLYWGTTSRFAGTLEFLIDPFFIAGRVTADVRSGQTGYAWIIDQNLIMLAHYEHEFVGYEAMKIRIARNPDIVFRGLRELHENLLGGKEGVTEYDSGWHRQKLGQMPKLAAYTPILFDKGLITGITEVEDPKHNLWGVCVVAPVAEVAGQVTEVMHQELFLVGLFFLAVLVASGGLIGTALFWNKTLTRQVEAKTRALVDSQERLVHSERFAAVGEAAAYVSHEIKNPLMVIGGMASQVERRLPQDPAAQEKLQIIQREVKRLESFLGELRDFLRPAPPSKREMDLNRLIRDLQNLMEEAAREKSITLETRLDPGLPRIEADPNQMEQVLLNLIKNAMEATEGNGRIVVASGTQDGQVWFSVQDTGKGMPAEVLEKIFHPFFTTKDKGTGLGLAVIHKIITDHHGTITVDSVAGEGSTFTVRLPRQG